MQVKISMSKNAFGAWTIRVISNTTKLEKKSLNNYYTAVNELNKILMEAPFEAFHG